MAIGKPTYRQVRVPISSARDKGGKKMQIVDNDGKITKTIIGKTKEELLKLGEELVKEGKAAKFYVGDSPIVGEQYAIKNLKYQVFSVTDNGTVVFKLIQKEK